MHNEQSTFANKDCKYKIVFLGDSSVGKTSLVQHIINGQFKQSQNPTLFLESAKKTIVHKGHLFQLMLWDTAGQEKFNSLIPSFVRGCDCAVITYDIANKVSLDNCQKWLSMVRNKETGHQCAVILVGNKADLSRNVTKSQGFEFALKHKLAYVETSAKTGSGVESLVAQIVQQIQKIKFKSQKQTKSSEGQLNSSRKLATSKITKVNISQKSIQLKIKQKSQCCSI